MSIDVSKGKEAVAGLLDSMKEYSDERKTFVNTTDLREALEYIQLLEEKAGWEDDAQPENLDTVSELVQGDTVRTLIRYNNYPVGLEGTVSAIHPHYEYPIEVDFDGTKIGYDRHELGKVIN